VSVSMSQKDKRKGSSQASTTPAPGNGGGIRTGHAGVAEWTALLTIYTTTDVFLSYPSRVAGQTAEAAWMVPLLSGLIAAMVFWFIQWLLSRFQNEGLLDVLDRTTSSVVSMVVALIGFVFFMGQSALVMREFTETVVTTVLPATPATVVTLLFLGVIIYYAYKGLEGLTRVAIVLSVILAAGTALLLVLPLTWFNPRLLSPVFGNGVGSILFYGFTNTSMFMPVFVLTVLRTTVRNQQHILRIGMISSIMPAAIMSLVLIVFIGIFASSVTGQVPFPMYQLARLIYVGRFVQRLESLFVFLWTAAAVIKMGLGLWLSAYLYARAFRMPLYRPLTIPLGLILFVLCFIPPDFTTVVLLNGNILERWGWIVTIALPVLAALLAVVADKLKKRRADKKSGTGTEDEPKTKEAQAT